MTRSPTNSPALLDLGRDERSGFGAVSALAATGGRLHRDRRGNISILFLFFGLLFYALCAMTWNTGATTAAKIEAQTAADAAAYSSAVWNSRATNVATATNMALQASWSAHVAGAVVDSITLFVPITWIVRALIQSIPCGPGFPACFAKEWALILKDVPFYAAFLYEARKGIGTYLPLSPKQQMGRFRNKTTELYDYQLAWMGRDRSGNAVDSGAPKAIRQQIAMLEEYYDCDIDVAQPGNTRVEPPVVAGRQRPSSLSIVVPFYTLRMMLEVVINKDGWLLKELELPQLPNLPPPPKGKVKVVQSIKYGLGTVWWLVGMIAGHLESLGRLVVQKPYHVLATQWGPFEKQLWFDALRSNLGEERGAGWWNSYLAQQAPFTVVATARKRNVGPLLTPGLFAQAIDPVAYAQAETFHAIHWSTTRLEMLPFALVLNNPILPLPWRLWSPYGWQWEARLTRGDLLGSALPNLNRKVALGATLASDVDEITKH